MSALSSVSFSVTSASSANNAAAAASTTSFRIITVACVSKPTNEQNHLPGQLPAHFQLRLLSHFTESLDALAPPHNLSPPLTICYLLPKDIILVRRSVSGFDFGLDMFAKRRGCQGHAFSLHQHFNIQTQCLPITAVSNHSYYIAPTFPYPQPCTHPYTYSLG